LFRNVTYESALPYQGMQATLFLKNGKSYTGRVVQVRQDGILFHSSNPGFLFLPFAAIALLALSFGAGYGLGRAAYPPYGWYGGYPYRPYPYLY
jgi:hypothetical protein